MDDLDSLLGELVDAKEVRSSGGDVQPITPTAAPLTFNAAPRASSGQRASVAPVQANTHNHFDDYLGVTAVAPPPSAPPPRDEFDMGGARSSNSGVAPEVDDLLSQLETASVRQNRFTMSPSMLAAQGGLPQALANIENEIGMKSAAPKQHASVAAAQPPRATVSQEPPAASTAQYAKVTAAPQYASISRPQQASVVQVAAPVSVPQPQPVQPQFSQARETYASPPPASTAQRAQITRVAAQPSSIQYDSVGGSGGGGGNDYLAANQKRDQASDAFYAKKEKEAAQRAQLQAATRAQQIVIEEVKPASRNSLSSESQLGGQNKKDAKDSTFSNYVEPPKPEHQIEDPRDYQVNAVVKKLIQTIQGPNANMAVTALKSIPMLAKSEPNMRSMRKGGLVGILIKLVASSNTEGVPDFAGKAVEGLMAIDPNGTLAEIDTAGGVNLLLDMARSSNPATTLQGLKLLSRYAKRASDKRAIADRSMGTLSNYVRQSATPAIQHQAVVCLYHIFESVGTHQMFVDQQLAAPIMKLLKENPGTQSWALGTVGRVSMTPAAYQTIVANGLKEVIDELFLSRSPVIANIAVSIHGAADLRAALIQAEKTLQSALKDD